MRHDLQLVFLRAYVPLLHDGTNRCTRRAGWTATHAAKFLRRVGYTVRACHNWKNDSHFGWVHIASMHQEQRRAMPATDLALEGHPSLTLAQFFALPMWQGTGDTTPVWVIRFAFSPL